MIEDAFVNLCCHSTFSFNRSLVTPERLAEEAFDKLMPSIALTDTGNLYGAIRFAKRAKELDIKPIIGCELPGRMLQGHLGQAPGLILLCKDCQGYRNLCRLVTLAQKAAKQESVISRALIKLLSKGLVAISPPGGASDLCDLFEEGDFYLGIDHNLKYDKDLRERSVLPLVGISDVRFINKEDAPLFDKLLQSAPPEATDGLKPFLNNDLYFKDDSELIDLFLDFPEAIYNTVEIAEKCGFDFEFGKTRIPKLSGPTERNFEKIARQGLEDLFAKQKAATSGLQDEYSARLELELSVIENLDLERPIWMLWDICRALEAHDIPHQAQKRSTSLVYYCLGISAVDPVIHRIPFDGFMTGNHGPLPLMDVYLPMVGKDFLVEYLKERYGEQRVAQKTAVFKTLHDKDFPERNWLPREASAAGTTVVIGEKDLREIAPVSFDEYGDALVHYHSKDIRRLGLFSFWCFESRAVDVLREMIRIVRESGKKPPRLRDIPLDDKKTFALFAQGKTTGIFNFEPKTMKGFLKRLKPAKFEQLVAISSLYHPEKIQMGMVEEYIDRAVNDPPSAFLAENELKPILEETYGLIVYDEQILRIMTDYAGILAYDAMPFLEDLKKRGHEEHPPIMDQFIKCSRRRGHKTKESDEILRTILHFSKYTTSKAHAVSETLLAYWMQYFYANYNGLWGEKTDKRRIS